MDVINLYYFKENLTNNLIWKEAVCNTGCFSLNFIYTFLIEFRNHSCSYSNPLVIIVSLKFGYIHEALSVSAMIQMNSLLLAIKISRG